MVQISRFGWLLNPSRVEGWNTPRPHLSTCFYVPSKTCPSFQASFISKQICHNRKIAFHVEIENVPFKLGLARGLRLHAFSLIYNSFLP